METPKLEKVIERLEKLDIEAWEYKGNSFNAKYGGLLIHLHVYKDMGLKCHIELINEDNSNSFLYKAKNKTGKEMIKNFYDNLRKRFYEFKDKELEEKVINFLSE